MSDEEGSDEDADYHELSAPRQRIVRDFVAAASAGRAQQVCTQIAILWLVDSGGVP